MLSIKEILMDSNNNVLYERIFQENNDEEEQQFYEGGAHFPYIELYKILDKIVNENKNKNDEEKKLVNLFNLNNKGKSRNVILEKDNKQMNKKEEEEKNSDKNIFIHKRNKPIINKKKKLAVSSFTITDKKIQGLINMNILTKNKNEKVSSEKKLNNSKPVSVKTKNSKINKKVNIRNDLKEKKRNESIDNFKNIGKQILSFSCQNLYRISSTSNSYNSISKKNNNKKNYISPINNIIMDFGKINNKNKVLNASIQINSTIIKDNYKAKNKDCLFSSLKENKNKSRNLNSDIQILNIKNLNEEEQNKNKCSKTFHNNEPMLNNNKTNLDDEISIQVEKNLSKQKPHSSEKSLILKNQISYINNQNIPSKNKKMINNNINSIFHHPKNSLNKLQNLAFINKKKSFIHNIKPVDVSFKHSINSSYNLNTQISSRNTISKSNKSSNNKSQMQNLHHYFSKNTTINTLTNNSNSNNNQFGKNFLNNNIVNKNSKEKKISSNNNNKIINKTKIINCSFNPKQHKSNIIMSKIKNSKEKTKI